MFHKPHPFIFSRSSVVLPGAVTFLVIALLAPLRFQTLEVASRIGFAIAFGIIASFSVWVIVRLTMKVHPDYEENWTIGKEGLLVFSVIFFIGLIIYFLFLGFDLTELDTVDLFQSVLINTLVISFFPVIILILFEQYQHQKKQWKQAQKLNKQLPFQSQTEELIALKSEGGKIELQLKGEEIRYLKSDGNYVEVFYMDESIKKSLVRNRLKVMIETLPSAHFIHCHKSYIVNKNAILKVNGNARNFELQLRGVDQIIPVSRAKSVELSQFLKG